MKQSTNKKHRIRVRSVAKNGQRYSLVYAIWENSVKEAVDTVRTMLYDRKSLDIVVSIQGVK